MRTIDRIGYEWKMQFRRVSAALLLLAFASVLLYAGLAGKAERDERAAAIAAHDSAIAADMQAWLDDLLALQQSGAAAPPRAGSAMDVVFASSLPLEPLADFAVGQSDLLPYVGTISLWYPDMRLFSKYEFADPVALALGSFDISKALLVFLPLLLIVFCFDVIAADRDSGRLGLMVAQGASIRRLFWQRLLFRAGIVLLVTFVAALAVLVIGPGEASLGERVSAFAYWSLLVLLYAFFWLMLVAWVASSNSSGESSLLALLGLWVGLTLVIPAAASATAEALYPAPSRLAYLADARQVENETRLRVADVANEFMFDHPELLVDQESRIPDYVRAVFLVSSAVDTATRPVVDSFAEALRDRESVIGLFRYVLPAVAVHGLFNELAGTSARRHQQYLSQAWQFKAEYAELAGPNIVARQPVNLAFHQSLPRFQFVDEPLEARLLGGAGPMLVLFLFSVGMALLVGRRLRTASPIST